MKLGFLDTAVEVILYFPMVGVPFVGLYFHAPAVGFHYNELGKTKNIIVSALSRSIQNILRLTKLSIGHAECEPTHNPGNWRLCSFSFLVQKDLIEANACFRAFQSRIDVDAKTQIR